MKLPLFYLFALGVLCIQLTAQIREYSVTPDNLADWQIVGTERASFEGQTILSVPAGAQLTRNFGGGSVLIYAVSRPNFGKSAVNWPVVQVGPVSLALFQEGEHGQLAILISDRVTVVPGMVALDRAGNAEKPLELVIAYNPESRLGVVAAGDQLMAFDAAAPGLAVETTVAAGEESPWIFDSLEVVVLSADALKSERIDIADPVANAKATDKVRLLNSAAEKIRHRSRIGGVLAESALKNDPVVIKAGEGMEVSTPSPVRLGIAEIRAMIERKKAQ